VAKSSRSQQPSDIMTMESTITNKFTEYKKTIITKDFPSVSTIKKHVRASKAKDCRSVTYIYIDGEGFDLCGNDLVKNDQYEM